MMLIFFDPMTCLESSAPQATQQHGQNKGVRRPGGTDAHGQERFQLLPTGSGNVKSWAGFYNSLGEKMLKNINQSINQSIYLSTYIYIYDAILGWFHSTIWNLSEYLAWGFQKSKGRADMFKFTCLCNGVPWNGDSSNVCLHLSSPLPPFFCRQPPDKKPSGFTGCWCKWPILLKHQQSLCGFLLV